MTYQKSIPRRQPPYRLGFSLIGAIWAAVAGPALAQQPQQQPTFKVSVNVVDVDVTVKDAQGNFVSGLGADDFEVFEDGKPQTIQTFWYIELPVERPDRYRFGGRPVPADVRSNRDVSSGRVYIILLDDLNVAPLRTGIVRRHAREFIERHFGPNDLAAVVVTSGRKDAAQEFTNDPALLLRAVDGFVGQRLQSAEVQRIDDYYQSLALSGLDTREKTGKGPQDEAVVPNLLTRMQSFDPSNSSAASAQSACSNTFAACRNISKVSVDAARRCCGSPKASTIRWPKRSARRAATKSRRHARRHIRRRAARTSTCSRSTRAG